MRRIFIVLSMILLSLQAAHASVPTTETGTASYYSKFEVGRKTASGERYNPSLMTAASRSFPLGTIIKVINMRNGKSVILRVNDRGPYTRSRSRILDVSEKAARYLGMMHSGVIYVKIIRMPIDFLHHCPYRLAYN